MRKTVEELMEGRQVRRMKQEDKFLAKIENRQRAAERMIGELMRNGATVFYVFPVGGKYREDTSFSALVDHLVRNRYV